MASPQRLSLQRSMDQFRRELTDDQREEISGANRTAINHEIEKIQTKLGRENSLCRLGRMTKFLDVMEEMEKLVSIFLNVSEVVAFIWGPIKLVLIIATTWTNSIKSIIDVYEEITVVLDNLAVFHTLIRGNEQLKRVLEDYFSDILHFHRSILDVFSKPDWKKMFLFVWRDFRRRVKPTIESMKRKQAMLSDDKLQQHAMLKTLQDSDLYTKGKFEQINSGLSDVLTLQETRSQKQQKVEIKSSLEKKLNVSLPQTSSQLELPDKVIENSGSWILSNPRFQSWEINMSSEGCVLFLNGCPGAGKSTLARTIIRHLNEKRSRQSQSESALVYFFFKHNDADRRSTRSMLCHIITQIINSDDTVMRFAYDKSSSMDYLPLSFLKTLASDCLLSQRDPMIVLDGLDEAQDNEPESALKWCLYDLLPMATSQGRHVRVLICGQEDGRIEPFLCSYPQIRLHTVDPHMKDIEDYCKEHASVIGKRFRLPPGDVQELIIKISKAANGMFLYAKVVLANLVSMGSRKEFKTELEDDKFPRDLDEAYHRILQRIIHIAGPSAQSSAKKILGWLICSERPLRWREIQSRFCIDVDSGLCDADDVRADSCKQLCSSIVDVTDCELFPGVESEQTITIIHETASKYLVHTNTIDIMQEHIAMSLFCCRYLGSRPFISAESGELIETVRSGYFGFMDYAAAFYQSHITKANLLKSDTNSDSDSELAFNTITAKDAVSDMAKSYYRTTPDTTNESDTVACNYEENRNILVQAIQDRVFDIRAIIHSHWVTLSRNPGFNELEGEKRHKCTKLRCVQFSIGYLGEAECQRHIASHERPFRCKVEDCVVHVVGYASEKELQRHNQIYHNNESRPVFTFPTGNRSSTEDLAHACKAGDLIQVKLAHRLGGHLDTMWLGAPPLLLAFEAGHGHICKYLIEKGVNPFGDVVSTYETSPVGLAIRRQNFDLLEVFLLSHKDFNSPLNSQRLEVCVRDILQNYPPAVDILLRILATRQSDEGSELLKEILADELATLFGTWGGQVTSFPANLDVFDHSNDATPIHTMFRRLFPKLYNRNGFLPDQSCQEYKIYKKTLYKNKLLLHNALLGKQYPLAAFLMEIDHDNVMQTENASGNSLLHSFVMECCGVACNGCVLMIERLLRSDNKELADVPGRLGLLPAHMAVIRNLSSPVLQAILKFTKDLNHKDLSGISPLHYAQDEESLITLLHYKDVDLFSRDSKGRTCFVKFCLSDRTFDDGLMRILLEADVRLAWTADETEERYTPLYHAMYVKIQTRFDTRSAYRNPYRPSKAAKYLLLLPEVEQVLLAYSTSSVIDCERVRDFARGENLEHALEVMEKISFGLSARARPTSSASQSPSLRNLLG